MSSSGAESRIPTSRSRSVLAELKPLPWLYPYREDPHFTRMDQPIFRPFVEVSLAHAGETTTVLDGLVDTGADAILASDLLAEQLGIDLEDNEGETSHGVGGKYHKAQYKTISSGGLSLREAIAADYRTQGSCPPRFRPPLGLRLGSRPRPDQGGR
jgi:Aspartyl protease